MIDLHMHTTNSDGMLTPEALLTKARENGISIASITDHNHTITDLAPLRAKFPDMTLIQGAEFSCIWFTSGGRKVVLHVLGYGFDPNHELLQAVLMRNSAGMKDPRINVEKRLAPLRALGMPITYEEVVEANPGTDYYGKKAIAVTMVKKGYVKTVDEALDEYVGTYGARKAFVEIEDDFVTLEECVIAIRAASGVAVLAHLDYYKLTPAEEAELLPRFHFLTGDHGGLEVYYGPYDEMTQLIMLALSIENGLSLISAGSDYHGQSDKDRLDHGVPPERCRKLLCRLGVAI